MEMGQPLMISVLDKTAYLGYEKKQKWYPKGTHRFIGPLVTLVAVYYI